MDLEMARRTALRDAAFAAVAATDESLHARRDILRRAREWRLDRSDPLCVALGTFDIGGLDRDSPTGCLVPALPAALAHQRQNLVLRAAGVVVAPAAIDHGRAQRGDQRVVVEVHPAFVGELVLRLPKQRERRRSDLEAHGAWPQIRIDRIPTTSACSIGSSS